MRLEDHKILILGWPVQPVQEWVKNYPYITVTRIYQEGLPRIKKRWMNASFHTPKWLQKIKKLNPTTWYGEWRNHIADYDTVVLIDEIRGRDIFEYIYEKNPNCKVCVFYDSPIKAGSKREPSLYQDLPIKFYTCDRRIANEYGIKFMPYFYIFSPIDFNEYDKLLESECEQDVFFLGEEKGDRLEQLKHIRQEFDKLGITHDLRLVRKRHGKHYNKEELAQTVDYMPYVEYIEHIRHSKAILELISNGQTGLTQRAFEALFFRKKLITNSEEINQYGMLDENDVVLIDENLELKTDISKLNCQNSKLTNRYEIQNKYTMKAWLEKFIK